MQCIPWSGCTPRRLAAGHGARDQTSTHPHPTPAPRARLLGSFQAGLDEITLMAIPGSPGDAAGGPDQGAGRSRSAAPGATGIPSGFGPGGGYGGEGDGAHVRIQSFIDPAKSEGPGRGGGCWGLPGADGAAEPRRMGQQ